MDSRIIFHLFTNYCLKRCFFKNKNQLYSYKKILDNKGYSDEQENSVYDARERHC